MQNRSISFYFDISMDFYYYSQLVITIYSKKGRIYSSNILCQFLWDSTTLESGDIILTTVRLDKDMVTWHDAILTFSEKIIS